MISSNKLLKIEKSLGKETIAELEALSGADLKTAIVQAVGCIKITQEELEANPAYQELKENLKALSSGLREVKARQNSVIAYSLHLLGEKV